MDPHKTLTRLHLAVEQAETLQAGISSRQRDVLALEQTAGGLNEPDWRRVVIDQAEDIRRAAQIHREEHLTPVRDALSRADELVARAGVDGDIDPAFARTLTHIISTCGEQTRRAEFDLADVERAMRPVAQATPTSPELDQDVRTAVDKATKSLETAHGWSFRLTSDLPQVDRAVTQIAQTEPEARDVAVDYPNADVQQLRSRGVQAEQRRPPTSAPAHQRRAAPGY